MNCFTLLFEHSSIGVVQAGSQMVEVAESRFGDELDSGTDDEVKSEKLL